MNPSTSLCELKPEEFHRAAPLFTGMAHHLAIVSVLAGRTPARIFIDDHSHPQAALVWAGHRIHLAGNPARGEFNSGLAHLFAGQTGLYKRPAGPPVALLYYEPAAWSTPIETVILRDKQPVRHQSQYYVLRAETPLSGEQQVMLPAGFRLLPADAALLAQTHLLHLDDLQREMCSERPSVEDFLDKSFGVCVLHGSELAGWCLSEYNTADHCEIGIETVGMYQRHGLATAMTLALVETGRARGIRVFGWHCWSHNTPSAATALRAGFRQACDYPAYYLQL